MLSCSERIQKSMSETIYCVLKKPFKILFLPGSGVLVITTLQGDEKCATHDTAVTSQWILEFQQRVDCTGLTLVCCVLCAISQLSLKMNHLSCPFNPPVSANQPGQAPNPRSENLSCPRQIWSLVCRNLNKKNFLLRF